MTRHIALLRGINLGARNRIGMQPLRESLTAAGYADVRSHLQSGNIVLTSGAQPAELAAAMRQHLSNVFSLDVDVVVRTRDELAGIVARDPFGDLADDPKRYQVSLLATEPDPRGAEEVTAADISPERVVFSGREIYAWHPGGIQRSKLAAMLTPKRLGTVVTARNWNTITTLLSMADG